MCHFGFELMRVGCICVTSSMFIVSLLLYSILPDKHTQVVHKVFKLKDL